MAKKTLEELQREQKIAELQKAVTRAEGRGQFDTSYHELLARLLNPPKADKADKETKE